MSFPISPATRTHRSVRLLPGARWQRTRKICGLWESETNSQFECEDDALPSIAKNIAGNGVSNGPVKFGEKPVILPTRVCTHAGLFCFETCMPIILSAVRMIDFEGKILKAHDMNLECVSLIFSFFLLQYSTPCSVRGAHV